VHSLIFVLSVYSKRLPQSTAATENCNENNHASLLPT